MKKSCSARAPDRANMPMTMMTMMMMTKMMITKMMITKMMITKMMITKMMITKMMMTMMMPGARMNRSVGVSRSLSDACCAPTFLTNRPFLKPAD